MNFQIFKMVLLTLSAYRVARADDLQRSTVAQIKEVNWVVAKQDVFRFINAYVSSPLVSVPPSAMG